MPKRAARSPSSGHSCYADLSKEQLIERLIALEKPFQAAKTQKTSPLSSSSSKPHRPMQWEKYRWEKIAFRILYLGWNYHGVACQSSSSQASADDNDRLSQGIATVEREFFQACLKSRLFLHDSLEKAEFSRCGRTDAGVSAFCQVLAAKVRGSLKEQKEPSLPDYCRILNSLLPRDIRVLAYAQVPFSSVSVDDDCGSSWNARFSCRWRQYKYLFLAPKDTLNLEAMQKAGEKLIGEHDFRMFCRRDPNKPNETFVRRILEFSLLIRDSSVMNGPFALVELNIKGSGFLLNQVRCIVGILYHIGSGNESPQLVDELLLNRSEKFILDENNHLESSSFLPMKPAYEIASEFPLILWNVGYEEESSLKCWNTPDDASIISMVVSPLAEQMHEFGAKFAVCHAMIQEITSSISPSLKDKVNESLLAYKQPLEKSPFVKFLALKKENESKANIRQ